jgi:hypothetical protein
VGLKGGSAHDSAARHDQAAFAALQSKAASLGNKATLLEDVQQDGEVLVLNDGRRFVVADTDDATIASIWLPTARITLQRGKGRIVRVTNADTGETVIARER